MTDQINNPTQKPAPKDKNSTDNIFLNAAAMAGGTMMSRVLGLFRDITFAAFFDRTITDAWGVAFRLPNLFRRLLGEGSLSVAFIPVFIECKNSDSKKASDVISDSEKASASGKSSDSKKASDIISDSKFLSESGKNSDSARASNLINSFYTMLLMLLGVLTLLGILFSKQIIGLIINDHFSSVPGKFELTVRMSQIMFGFIFLMSTYAFFMGILNSLGEYKIPAMAPTFFNVAMIVSNFIPKSWQPIEGDALAWGVIVGGFLQTIVLVPALIKKGYFPKPKWDFGNRDSRRVWLNMLPGMLGTGLLQITTIINTNFASSLGEGSNTYIYLADRLLELPLSLVAVSLGTALLPTLSNEFSNGRKQKMIDTLSYYLRVNLYVCLPAAVGLLILAYPITKILFGRGEFVEADVLATKSIVMVYALTLIVSSSVRVLVPGFYAIKNTWLPSTVSLIAMITHILVAPILMKHYQLVGLVASTCISGFVNFALVYVCYRFMVGSLGLWTLIKRLILFLVPLSGVVVVCLLGQYAFGFANGLLERIAILSAVLVMAAYVYFKISKTMDLEEYKTSFAKLFFLLRHI